jgi:hypothetical protein
MTYMESEFLMIISYNNLVKTSIRSDLAISKFVL